jgi:hypothetical protein
LFPNFGEKSTVIHLKVTGLITAFVNTDTLCYSFIMQGVTVVAVINLVILNQDTEVVEKCYIQNFDW